MKNRKDGVAVIIVLGLLALLMVLGVAFSVSMRVERAGAANYTSAVRTRQMVWAGLARAIGDINQMTDMYPDGDGDVLVSGGSAWGASAGGGVRLLYGGATNHVPDIMLTNSITGMRSQWLALGEDGNSGEGYAAYIVLNLSDMLDLNYVGGSVRAGGTNAVELVLDGIGVDGVALAAARDVDGPFESLAEFKAFYPEISTYALSSYSRYLPDANRVDAVYIGGTEADLLADEDSIVTALQEMAASGGQGALAEENARAVFTNLLDYIDADSEPRNLMGPNTEAVPMLNEVAIANVILNPPAGNTLSAVAVQGDIETWYPFLQQNAAGLDFRVGGFYRFEVEVSHPDLGVVSASSNSTFLSAQDLDYQNREFPLHNPFFIAGVLMPGGGVAVSNDSMISISLSISNLTVNTTSGTVVDKVDGVFTFTGSGPYGAFPGITSDPSFETYDPRFNWLAVPPYWNAQATSSIGSTNNVTLTALASPAMAAVVERGGFKLHVSDRERLVSPLELGYLPRTDLSSSILQTFRVFDPDGAGSIKRHEIMEHFTVNDGTGIQRGVVNVNTLNSFILDAVFRDMPHPYIGAPTTLGETEITAVKNLFALEQAGGSVFSNLTDVLDFDWRSEPDLDNFSDGELEAIAAYSTGLMGVRQNLFLIVVSASAASGVMGEHGGGQVGWRGRQRAIAVVWRDPVANAQGLHDCFIRMFKWLD